MKTDLSALIGRSLTSVVEDKCRITLKFDDGTAAEITAEAGMGYNEGLAWLMKERDEKAHLLDWAESLLCNALPMSHCTQEEWDVAVKNWRDEKHGVKKPNASDQATASKKH